MKNLSEMVYEASEDQVYAIYLEDGTLYNYYEDEKEDSPPDGQSSPCNPRKTDGSYHVPRTPYPAKTLTNTNHPDRSRR